MYLKGIRCCSFQLEEFCCWKVSGRWTLDEHQYKNGLNDRLYFLLIHFQQNSVQKHDRVFSSNSHSFFNCINLTSFKDYFAWKQLKAGYSKSIKVFERKKTASTVLFIIIIIIIINIIIVIIVVNIISLFDFRY